MIAQFLQQQFDYILFFYGFSFILLAATCITIRQETWRRLPWIWLALFGLAQGINEWLDLLALDFGDSTSFTAIRLGLMTLSFIFLFEFGRVGLHKLNGKGPGRWIYIPLMACTLLGGFWGLSGLNAGARYAFGLTGGFLAALVLFRFSKSRKIPILSLAAVLMAAYALAAGLVVPESSFFPASIINQTAFFTFTGLPIQIIKGNLIFFMAATVWRFYELTRVEVLPDSRRHIKNHFGLQFILILLLILVAGWIFTKLIGDHADEAERKDILNQAKMVAAALNTERVKNLTGSITDLQLPDYVRLRQQLVDMNQSDPYLRWLYLMFLKDGKIIFAVGSVPKGDTNATPGVPYEKPPAELAEVFRKGLATTAGPYTDEYGSFISGFVPIRDLPSGAILGVLGTDHNAATLQASVLQMRFLSISVTLLFCLLVTGFYVIRLVAAESAERITASEEKFRLLFDAAADPILLLDDTAHIIDCNAAAVQILGVTSKNQILNQHLSSFSPERQPDGQLSSVKEDLMFRMATEDSSKHFEWTNCRPDGMEFIVSVTLTFLTMEGKKVHLVHWRDITENTRLYQEVQREKNYFESLVSHNPAATVVIDSDNKVLSWNPAAEKLFGYTQAEAMGRNVDELVASEAMQAEANAYTELALKGELINVITKRSRRDGTLVDVELSAVPVHIEGQQVGTIAIYHDVTDLRKAHEDAEAANQAKSAFLANMSHEIRTPLNAIIGMTSLLLDTKLDTEQGNFVETVRTGSDVLLDLINDILDFSKIEAHKMELEDQLFNLRLVVEEALDLVAPKAAANKIELAYMIDEGLPVFYTGDATRLRQILVNLLGNAVKFTDIGEVVVSVSGQLREKHQYFLHFSIRDTGLGIPPDRADRLFQSFSQVDSSTTRRFGGTGLGLAISKLLCEMMGGTIWVESTGVPGEGSTFHFTILAQAAPEQEKLQVEPEKVDLIGKKVLVVDDNKTNRQIITHQIESWGMNSTAVASGPEALSLLRQGDRFDLVLMDMQMPEMDGLTLAAEIRKEYTEQMLPLVLISSLGYRETQPEHAFFAAYLTKPIKPSVLYNSLATAIMKRPVVEHKVTQPIQFDRGLGQRHPLRLLVAEDNVVNQKVVLSLLERLGYRADIASNGLEVLDALRRQPYDVILMDGQMPEMDGEEATIVIRREWPIDRQPHIIAVTANALQGDRERYFYIGMDDYISKPIRIEELIRALSRSEPLSDQENQPGPEQTLRSEIEPPVSETTPASSAAEVNTQPPAQASIDFSYLREFQSMMGEDGAHLVKDLVNLYLNNVTTLINEMRQGIANQNTDQLQRAAHTLKGNSSQVGALKLSVLSDELEMVAQAGSVEDAESMLEKINLEFSMVKIDLGAEFTT